ncbi:hypothetical protein E1B28_007300 [Marasmius oreades]|nr:uncharacterized protein E1B28_007300 [Marasmius oreades]KAG7093637.1 hypothetical protein E1B28_007300 [Marasmius oreades]
MIHADYLFLLTDVDGLYTANPRKDPSAHLIEAVTSIPAIRSQVSTTTLGSSLGTGGMETKIIAAEIATGAGVSTIITSSKRPENIFSIIEYHNTQKTSLSHMVPQVETASRSPAELFRPPHTIFLASPNPMTDMKSWITHTLFPAGSVVIDGGAHHVLSRRESGGRLLPAGVIGVIGAFASGQAVRIVVLKEPWSSADIQEASYSAQSTRPSSPTGQVDSATLSRSASNWDLTIQVEDERLSEDNVTEVGRGLANYNSMQISQVKGRNSSYIVKILGYADSEYVAENITIRVAP